MNSNLTQSSQAVTQLRTQLTKNSVRVTDSADDLIFNLLDFQIHTSLYTVNKKVCAPHSKLSSSELTISAGIQTDLKKS